MFHAPLVSRTAGLQVSTVVTSDPTRAAQAAEDIPGVLVVDRLDPLLEGESRADLVVVAAANSAHVPVAERAIAADIPVVVDKPLAPDAAQAQALARQAEDAGVLLTVFHNRRWDGDFLTVRDLVSSGRLGRVHRFESRFERWAPTLREGSWRENPDPPEGAGLLLDLGSHLVDQATLVLGPVATVAAELDARRPGSAVEDDVFISLTHENGARSHLWASAVASRPGPRFRVLGSDAGYVKDGLDPQEQQLKGGMRPGDPGWGRESKDRDGTIGVGADVTPVPTAPGAYETFYARLVEALDGLGGVPVDPADAVNVLEILDAARRAATTRSLVVIGR